MGQDDLLARIDERVGFIAEEMKNLRAWQVDQDRRLGSLETFRSWVIGVGVAFGTIVGFLLKLWEGR
jgi:hypothetical protein